MQHLPYQLDVSAVVFYKQYVSNTVSHIVSPGDIRKPVPERKWQGFKA
jgi:hypothetical protein